MKALEIKFYLSSMTRHPLRQSTLRLAAASRITSRRLSLNTNSSDSNSIHKSVGIGSSSGHHSSFYQVSGLPEDGPISITGQIVDNAINLRKVRPGDVIRVPYELTISHSFRDLWQSAFYSHDRINTSTPFARRLGLQDQVLPFSLMLFLTGSMSHGDEMKLQVGYKNARYHWPAFAGDTVKKAFTIKSLRSTSDSRNSLLNIESCLQNQKGIPVFSCEMMMLLPFSLPPSEVVIPASDFLSSEDLLSHLIDQADSLQSAGSQTLKSLRPGQLLLHGLMRPISATQSMQLTTMARVQHELFFNTRRYRADEILVHGGLVLGLTCSLASRDLHEVIYEELGECAFPNNLNPGDVVGSMTFIRTLDEHISGNIESISVRTIGVKNIDIQRVLVGKELPVELFVGGIPRPSALEELLKRSCPELSKHVVCIADRKLYRPAPKQTPFLL